MGAVVIPGVAFGALLLVPWLDGGKERRPFKRPIGTSLMLLAIVSIFWLTYEAVSQHDWEAAAQHGAIVEEVEINQDHLGYEIWAAQGSCIGCHGDNMAGIPGVAPSNLESDYTKEEVIEIILNGKGTMPGGLFAGTDEELEILAEYIAADGNPE